MYIPFHLFIVTRVEMKNAINWTENQKSSSVSCGRCHVVPDPDTRVLLL